MTAGSPDTTLFCGILHNSRCPDGLPSSSQRGVTMAKFQQDSTNSNPPGHYINPDQLCVGLYVHLDLGWTEHPFTFSNFKIKNEDQILKIRNLQLKKIRIDPQRSDVIPDFPKTVQMAQLHVKDSNHSEPHPEPMVKIDPVIRQSKLKELNKAILKSKQSYTSNSEKIRETVRSLPHHPEKSRETAELLVKEWVNSVITESDVALHAIDMQGQASDTYNHSMNVTVIALMLAKSLDMKEQDALTLGIAAMFHDVGKEDELRKKSFVDLHCEIGSRMAERAGFSEKVCRTIEQHHEYMDGTGTPKHLRGGLIDPLARALCLVNHFDNLCNPPNLADALTPFEALSVMYATQQTKFDATMLQVFVRSLGVYPPGSIVQLSNDVFGMVISTNPAKPMQPIIMLHLPNVARETPALLDLSVEPNISIKKCIRPQQLPEDVRNYLQPRKRLNYYFLKAGQADGLSQNPSEKLVDQTSQPANHHLRRA